MSPRLLALGLCLALAGCASEPAPPAQETSEATTAGECCESQKSAEGCASCAEPELAAKGSEPAEPEAPESETPAAAGPSYVYRGPKPLDPAQVGIGTQVADAAFVDLAGQRGSLRALASQAPATVVLFTGMGCPVTKAYAPTLEALTKPWRDQGLAVLVVDPALLDTPDKLAPWAKRQGWTFRLTRDPKFALTAALGGRRTADAFLLDREGRLRYRGPIDDQYGINLRLPEPRHHLLKDAVAALLAGEEIKTPALEAPGCRITRVVLDDEE